jgi:WD40 repeat protein
MAGAVPCVALDPQDERWLLACDARGFLCLFDAERRGAAPGGVIGSGFGPRTTCLCKYPTAAPAASGAASTATSGLHTPVPGEPFGCVTWYGRDNGLFLTGAGGGARSEGAVTVWDTARFEPVFRWRTLCLGARGGPPAVAPAPMAVHSLACSPVASQHALVAVGSGAPEVRLVDLRTAAATLALAGHAGGVQAVAWGAGHEFLLVSGGCDATVRVWDVRRAGGGLGVGGQAQVAALDSSVRMGTRGGGGGGGGSAHVGAVNSVLALPQELVCRALFPGSGGGGEQDWGGRAGVAEACLGREGGILSAGADDAVRLWRTAQRPGAFSALAGPGASDRALRAAGGVGQRPVRGPGDYAPLPDVSVAGPGVGASADPATAPDVCVDAWNTGTVYPEVRNGSRGQNARPVSMAVAPAGPLGSGSAILFVPCTDGRIRCYDLASGEMISAIPGHHGPVAAVRFSGRLQECYSCGEDGSILRWTSPLLRPDRAANPRPGAEGGPVPAATA